MLVFFRVYLMKHQFKLGSVKLELVRSDPSTRTRGKVFIEKMNKQSNETDYRLSIIWEAWLAVCDWLFYLTSRHLQRLTLV